MKHTKGPWRVEKLNPTRPGLVIRAATNGPICYISDNPRAQYKPNAQLIAAAPELYDLLSKINTAFYSRTSRKEWLELMEQSKPLLQKARGN